jgi:hypothetical protein
MAVSQRSSAVAWWDRIAAGGSYISVVVIGPRKCGKSRLFTSLAADADRDLVVWDALSLARADSTHEVWSALWAVLGMEEPAPGDRPTEHLDLQLECSERSVTLVVDRWDQAIDGRDRSPSAPEHCYEVLDALARFSINQGRDRDRTAGFLSLVLLTSFPDASDLQYFASDAQRATFERLSQTITRTFNTERFPMLTRVEAEALLLDEGLSAAEARTVATACGGWPQLLLDAAEAVRGHGGSLTDALDRVRDVRVPDLLNTGVYKWLRHRPEVKNHRRDPAEFLETRLAAGDSPDMFGLPHDYARPQRVAPLIRRSLHRRFLVVDTENLYVPFSKDDRAHPGAYDPDGFVWHLQEQVVPWLHALREQHDVDAADVYFIGRTPERIDRAVGDPSVMPGHRQWLTDAVRQKERKERRHEADHSDDTLIAGRIGKLSGQHPLANVVLVSSDMDVPMVLAEFADKIWIAAPWPVSRALRAMFAGTGRFTEAALGERPRPVAQVRA